MKRNRRRLRKSKEAKKLKRPNKLSLTLIRSKNNQSKSERMMIDVIKINSIQYKFSDANNKIFIIITIF